MSAAPIPNRPTRLEIALLTAIVLGYAVFGVLAFTSDDDGPSGEPTLDARPVPECDPADGSDAR